MMGFRPFGDLSLSCQGWLTGLRLHGEARLNARLLLRGNAGVSKSIMTTETKPEMGIKLATELFWAIVIKHDISYMALHDVTGLGNAQLAYWNRHGVDHAPANAIECLKKLMQHLGVI